MAAVDELTGGEGRTALAKDHVRLHRREIDVEPRQSLQAFGQAPGIDVILREAIDHFVQRAQPRSGQHTRLAHTAADHLAHPASALEELARARQHGPDRRTQSLGEAEHDGVHRTGELADVDPLRDGGIENPGAVQVNLQAGLMSHGAERLGLGRAQTGPTFAIVGVLEAEQRTAWLMDVRFPDDPRYLLRLEPAVLAVQRAQLHPADDGSSSDFVLKYVAIDFNDDLVAGL